jgi:hypothetical protein
MTTAEVTDYTIKLLLKYGNECMYHFEVYMVNDFVFK